MRNLRLMLVLCLMSALPPLSIDMCLPAMGAIQAALGGTARDQELMLSSFMAGLSLTPLIYGALSDRYGRKPALYLGMALFTLAGVVCTLTTGIAPLLIGRFFQGSGAGAGIALGFAITRDLFDGPKLGSRLSIVAMVVNVAPMVAPSLGALMLGFTGWRGIFGVLTALGALVVLVTWFVLPETRAETRDHHPKPEGGGFQLGKALRALWGHPSALGYTVVYGVSFASIFAYIASSSLLLSGYFGVSAYRFALLFALTAIGIVGGAFVSGRMGQRVGGRVLIHAGLAMSLLGPGFIWLLFVLHHAALWPTMAGLVVATFGNGLINPAATKGALTPFPTISGLIGALLATVQMGCCALSSAVAAVLLNHFGMVAVPVVMLIFALLAAAIFIFGTKEASVTHG